MKDEKKVKAAEEEAKKEVKVEENGAELTDEELSKVSGGKEQLSSGSPSDENIAVNCIVMGIDGSK